MRYLMPRALTRLPRACARLLHAQTRLRRARAVLPRALALLTVIATSCHDGNVTPAARDAPVAFDSAVDLIRDIALAETDSVLNVAITARVDPAGGFLVTDAQEAEVRGYDAAGELRFRLGRRGRGPGEFVRPVTAIRLASRDILVIDRYANAAFFSSDGRALLKAIRTPFSFVQEADVINDSTILVSGTAQNDADNRLHVWDVPSNTIIASFHSPAIDAAMQPAAATAGWPAATVWHDTVAAIFSLSDTIYVYTTDGSPVRKMPFESRAFRRATPMPAGMDRDPTVARKWFESFDLVSSIHRTNDNGFLVEYQTVDSVWTMLYGLIRFDAHGNRVADITRSPRLLVADAARDSLYFVHPESELPNHWAVGVLHR